MYTSMQRMYFWCWNSTVNEIAWFCGKTSKNVIIQRQGCELFWWFLALNMKLSLFHKAENLLLEWDTCKLIHSNSSHYQSHSYTMCSKLNSPDSKWVLISAVQTSALSFFSTGELFPLFISELSVEKCSVYELIMSRYPWLLWLQHSTSLCKMQCGYFKSGLAPLIASKVATALDRSVFRFS